MERVEERFSRTIEVITHPQWAVYQSTEYLQTVHIKMFINTRGNLVLCTEIVGLHKTLVHAPSRPIHTERLRLRFQL